MYLAPRLESVSSIGTTLISEKPMSTWPIPSALDARTQAFPTLTETQIKRLGSSGELRKVNAGDILFEPGDTEVPFFVLLSGGMEIVSANDCGRR